MRRISWALYYYMCHCEESRSDDEAIPYIVAECCSLPFIGRLLRRTKVLLAMTHFYIPTEHPQNQNGSEESEPFLQNESTVKTLFHHAHFSDKLCCACFKRIGIN